MAKFCQCNSTRPWAPSNLIHHTKTNKWWASTNSLKIMGCRKLNLPWLITKTDQPTSHHMQDNKWIQRVIDSNAGRMRNPPDSILSFRTIQTAPVQEWCILTKACHRWHKIISKTNRNGKIKEINSKAFLCPWASAKIIFPSKVAKMRYNSKTRSQQSTPIKLGIQAQGLSQVRASRPTLRRSRARKYFRGKHLLVTKPTKNRQCQTINSHVKPQEPIQMLLTMSQMKAEHQHWAKQQIWYLSRTRAPRTRGTWPWIPLLSTRATCWSRNHSQEVVHNHFWRARRLRHQQITQHSQCSSSWTSSMNKRTIKIVHLNQNSWIILTWKTKPKRTSNRIYSTLITRFIKWKPLVVTIANRLAITIYQKLNQVHRAYIERIFKINQWIKEISTQQCNKRRNLLSSNKDNRSKTTS